MKIVFMGSSDFAVQSLMALQMAGHEICLVITQPDRRAFRGRKLTAPPVKKVAEVGGLALMQPENVNAPGPLAHLVGLVPDVVVVVAFGQILSPEFLNVPRMGVFNLHASLLPKYRGAAPMNWALMRGETETGVTVQAVTVRVDAGPIAGQEKVRILPQWNVGDLGERLAKVGAALLVKVLDQLELGELELTDQPARGVTYAPRLRKSDGIIDWTCPATELHNRVRGVTPWPGAQTFHIGESGRPLRLELIRTELASPTGHAGEPGEVVTVAEGGVDVACGEGVLRVLKLKAAGKREMPVGEFLRGRKWHTGDRLANGS